MTDGNDPSAADGDGTRSRRAAVRERYARIATASDSDAESESRGPCCGDAGSGCDSSRDRGNENDPAPAVGARRVGYSDEDLAAVEEGANLGLGCGNPTAIAALEAGETVLDLGAGGGFDCFLAARAVGPTGRVIGVDMTPEMVDRARTNAERNDASNVEFRLGEIEHLPVADGSVDVIISNCVVNLSPDKPQVLREAYRVLRPGGRLAVSDIVRTARLPAGLRDDPDAVASCVGGASSVPELEAALADAGFADVAVEPNTDSAESIREWNDERDPSDYVAAATVEATKPAAASGP